MLSVFSTNQFKKDYKKAKKRGKDLKKLKAVMLLLSEEKKLDNKYKEHQLGGNFIGYKECHIDPDWLLVYKVTASEIQFVRTGTHSDLFC